MSSLVFDVIGTPAPQGSKTKTRWGGMREDNTNVKPWRDSVSTAAVVAMRDAGQTAPIDEPVEVRVVFRLWRAPSIPKSRIWPMVKPDLDKLLRSTFDALVAAGALRDDSRIVSVVTRKEYATLDTGARISVVPVDEVD